MPLFVKKQSCMSLLFIYLLGCLQPPYWVANFNFFYLNFIKLSAIYKDKQSNSINQGRDKTML